MKKISIFIIIFLLLPSYIIAESNIPPFPIDLYEIACEEVRSDNPYYVLYKQDDVIKLGFLNHNDVYHKASAGGSSVYTRSANYVALFMLGENGWYRYSMSSYVPAGNQIGFTPTRNTIKMNANFVIYDEQGENEMFPYNPLPSNFFQVSLHKVVEGEMMGMIPKLVGQTQKILPVGFGMLLGIVLVRSLKVYYRYF